MWLPRFVCGYVAWRGIHSRFNWLRRIVLSVAYQKLLIIVGAFKWYDLPHLHHPLIWWRFRWEEEIMAKRRDK